MSTRARIEDYGASTLFLESRFQKVCDKCYGKATAQEILGAFILFHGLANRGKPRETDERWWSNAGSRFLKLYARNQRMFSNLKRRVGLNPRESARVVFPS